MGTLRPYGQPISRQAVDRGKSPLGREERFDLGHSVANEEFYNLEDEGVLVASMC